MPTNSLSDAAVRALKPRDKAFKVFDGGGLHIYVSPQGAKVWRLAYRVDGKPKTMSFGPYPEVTLAQARVKRDEARAVLRDRGDPMAPRKQAAATLTLKQAGEAYWRGRGDVSAGYKANATRALEMHVYPLLGDRLVAGLGREDFLTVLKPMDAAGLFDYVRKTRMWLSLVMDWCVERGDAQLNPLKLIDPKKAFGRREVEHFASVDLPEVGQLLKRLALEDQNLQSVLACKLLALTWVRTDELRGMLWSELDGDLWRIPAARMKKKRDHLVPLSKQALAILAQLRARRTASVYVFPNDRRLDRPMSENAILYLLGRIGYGGKMTGHGWRTVGSTWANEAGYRADAIERQLAHVPSDEVRAAYNRAEYLDLRRTMLQDFADWLDAQEARP